MTYPDNRYPYASEVTRLRRVKSGVDRYGNDTFTDQQTPMAGAVVWPLTNEERTDERQQVLWGMKMVVPPGDDVKQTDRFRIGSDPALWEVNSARDWGFHPNPWTGDVMGFEVILQRVTG